MARNICLLLLLAVAGCSGLPRSESVPSACLAGEATYDCQIERYHDISI